MWCDWCRAFLSNAFQRLVLNSILPVVGLESQSKRVSITTTEAMAVNSLHRCVDDDLIGKKQDKLGRWRIAKVSDYANDPVQAYAIDERIKQLGRSARIPEGACRTMKAKNFRASYFPGWPRLLIQAAPVSSMAERMALP
jgi:hypothetical protein